MHRVCGLNLLRCDDGITLALEYLDWTRLCFVFAFGFDFSPMFLYRNYVYRLDDEL